MTHSEAEETAAPTQITAEQLRVGDVVEDAAGFRVLELLGTDPETGDPMADVQRHVRIQAELPNGESSQLSFLLDVPLEVIRS